MLDNYEFSFDGRLQDLAKSGRSSISDLSIDEYIELLKLLDDSEGFIKFKKMVDIISSGLDYYYNGGLCDVC